ncbi:phosphate regulon transcriptional regulator PhoB [Thalassorhabdomicrobium marinisediminis]|uniref:phosphate regulon transcriptional regulator PhoB n=1 Tax=Thalassorhabdomicrobium marinisediminis TaxID=2170577 RepID=UPI0024913044|nr:phosphate regulon transcriptional regulator PhoB [Thalassorhabdomicrobium marinisediminis]
MADGGEQILVVEDEPSQLAVLTYNLRKAGYQVHSAADGEEADLMLLEQTPDLVLLDWMMPGVSGYELARRIRARPQTQDVPIIMLTARAEENDIVRGLDVGAHDYMTKPYSVAELLARVRAALRRNGVGGGETIQVAGIEMNTGTHRVHVAGQEVALGPLEFKLLRTLMERPDRVFEREQLLDRVWGRDLYVESRTVDVHISRLRKSLGPEASRLRTVRGKGYAIG